MTVVINGTTGITTPDITSDGGFTADGVSFASGAPANTLVTTSGGNVGIGTSSPSTKLHVIGAGVPTIIDSSNSNDGKLTWSNNGTTVGYLGSSSSNPFITYNSSGTITALVDSSSNLKFNSGYGSVATAYGCRAWVNFNGTGTVAIRASGNVSSITDGGVGLYTVNFTTALPDVNYTMNASCGGNGADYRTMVSMNDGTQAVGSIQIRLVNTTSGQVDSSTVLVSVHR